jgi:hypothetical protein
MSYAPYVTITQDFRNSTSFPEEEPKTERHEMLTEVLALLSGLTSETEKVYNLLQREGLTPVTRRQATDHLLNINQTVKRLEDDLGVYRQTNVRGP